MAKKIIIIISLAIPLFFSSLYSRDLFKIGPYVGYYSISDELVEELYEKGNMIYGFKLGVNIVHGFSAWCSIGRYTSNSETTYIGESTRLKLSPLDFSLRYTVPIRIVKPFLGVGYTFLTYKEESDIGDIKESDGGFFIEGGVDVRLSPRFSLDLGLKYSKITVNPTGFEVNLGGLQALISFLIVI